MPSPLGPHDALTPGTLFNLPCATISLGASRWQNRREIADRAHRLPAENLRLIEVVMCQLRAWAELPGQQLLQRPTANRLLMCRRLVLRLARGRIPGPEAAGERKRHKLTSFSLASSSWVGLM